MIKKYINILSALIFLFFFLPATSYALEEVKISAAVLEFTNNTGNSKYDYLEKAIPKTLTTELSRSSRLQIVEREKVDKIMREQELGMAGVTDNSKIGEIGKILAADIMIYGDYTFIESKEKKIILINVHYTKIKTGTVQSEKAKGELKFLDGHIKLLGNNLRNKIAGESDYKESLKVGTPVGRYLLISTGVTLATTGALQYFFMNAKDDYRNSKTLTDIDDNFKKANTLFWTRNAFAGVTLLMGIITITSYVKDWGDTGEIFAIVPFFSSPDLALSGLEDISAGRFTKPEAGLYLFYSRKF